MLVLSRKVGESIVVPGCNLTITVQQVRGNRVRLGIAAPPEIAIHREEVWQRYEDSLGLTQEKLHESSNLARA